MNDHGVKTTRTETTARKIAAIITRIEEIECLLAIKMPVQITGLNSLYKARRNLSKGTSHSLTGRNSHKILGKSLSNRLCLSHMLINLERIAENSKSNSRWLISSMLAVRN